MTKIHYDSFVDLKYKPKSTDVICQFKIVPSKGFTFREICSITAGESSVGTWTDVKTMNKKIGKTLSPKVFYLNKKENRCRIAYPIELFEMGNLPCVLSSIGGNIYGMKSAKQLYWEDIKIPKKMLKSFKGPQFGIRGIRKYLNVYNRPLVGTIVKPKVGLTSSQHAKVAYESWVGGCDIVKDDENLTSQSFNKFKSRFLKTIKACKRAEKETGEKKVYLVNCTAETDEMLKRIKFVEEHGGNYIMLDILTLGWAALQTARKHTKLPIHAHRAGHAMLDRDKTYGMSMEVIAQFARMVGVDTLHIGTAYGKMSGGKDIVLHIEEEMEHQFTRQTKENLSQRWFGVKPVFGVASGGVHPGIVPQIMKFMGVDVVIQAGGGIHGHPDGTVAGAIAMRQAVDATLNGISLRKYAKDHTELRKALEKWE
ncbi:type III ribulose-bisphosphate carboxylase [Candidatus Pacearchaeota archaeon ex4484_71]|nr:MAG: type III ribulose-bisphosphate carboxylase [Candidatus Pacearchaeota archaeon ex4484_71]